MAKRKGVRLIGAAKPYAGEEWQLRPTDDGLALFDEEGDRVTDIPDAEVSLRIVFPSFWASIRHLMIVDNNGHQLEFQPDSQAVARVRKLVEHCLYRDPENAARTMRGKALRDLAIGGGSFILGTCITAGTWLAAGPKGTFYVTTGLLLAGIIEIVRGLIWLLRAARLGAIAAEED